MFLCIRVDRVEDALRNLERREQGRLPPLVTWFPTHEGGPGDMYVATNQKNQILGNLQRRLFLFIFFFFFGFWEGGGGCDERQTQKQKKRRKYMYRYFFCKGFKDIDLVRGAEF